MKKENSIYPPGDFGIWLIIYIELITFGGLFIGFAVSRRDNILEYNTSQLMLNPNLGLINTIILITSSYCVIKAVHTAEISTPKQSQTNSWLLRAFILGGLFLVIKCIEFALKYNEGIDWSVNEFFMFYYILTGFHFLHVILGMIILWVMHIRMNKGLYFKDNIFGLQTGASYWHMIDLLWIVLFPLIYIMR